MKVHKNLVYFNPKDTKSNMKVLDGPNSIRIRARSYNWSICFSVKITLSGLLSKKEKLFDENRSEYLELLDYKASVEQQIS
jgi:hypothetical protein